MAFEKYQFPKYKKNLHYLASADMPGTVYVYSYDTWVASQRGGELVELEYHSTTTRKHVNYAAEQLGLTVKHLEL